MNIRTSLYDSFRVIWASIVLCCIRPQLFLYKLIPIAVPLILIMLADKYRMFDLSLHYRPVMTSVVYILTSINLIATVYLSRTALYHMYKREGKQHHFVRHSTLLIRTISWIVVLIGGIYLFSYMTQWIYTSVKNPTITKYDETYATFVKHFVPPLMLLLAFLWNFTALVPTILSSESLSLYTAVKRSCIIIGTHFLTFIFVWIFFTCLDVLPIIAPLSIPHRYRILLQVTPYCLELLITTLNAVAYAVFYKTYKTITEY